MRPFGWNEVLAKPSGAPGRVGEGPILQRLLPVLFQVITLPVRLIPIAILYFFTSESYMFNSERTRNFNKKGCFQLFPSALSCRSTFSKMTPRALNQVTARQKSKAPLLSRERSVQCKKKRSACPAVNILWRTGCKYQIKNSIRVNIMNFSAERSHVCGLKITWLMV